MFKLLVTLDNFSSAVVEFCLLHRDRKQAVEEKKDAWGSEVWTATRELQLFLTP